MKAIMIKNKIEKLKKELPINYGDLIYRYRLLCNHENGFTNGYCIDCEMNELYTRKGYKGFMDGEKLDRGLISNREYWENFI